LATAVRTSEERDIANRRNRYLSTALEKAERRERVFGVPSMMKVPISCLRQPTISEISN